MSLFWTCNSASSWLDYHFHPSIDCQCNAHLHIGCILYAQNEHWTYSELRLILNAFRAFSFVSICCEHLHTNVRYGKQMTQTIVCEDTWMTQKIVCEGHFHSSSIYHHLIFWKCWFSTALPFTIISFSVCENKGMSQWGPKPRKIKVSAYCYICFIH